MRRQVGGRKEREKTTVWRSGGGEKKKKDHGDEKGLKKNDSERKDAGRDMDRDRGDMGMEKG